MVPELPPENQPGRSGETSGSDQPAAPHNDFQPTPEPTEAKEGSIFSLTDADFDALFSDAPALDNASLRAALGVTSVPEIAEHGLLYEALRPRLPGALWGMVQSGRAPESPLGTTENEMPVSLFEFRRGSQWLIPDAEMLAAPLEPDRESGGAGHEGGKKRVTTAVVTHSGRVDDSALERSSSPVKVALTQLPIDQGGGLDIAVQVAGMEGLEELLSRIEAPRESPEHYRASIARYELDRRVRELVTKHVGRELFGELDYISMRRQQSPTPDSVSFDVVLALPPSEYEPDAGYRAIEIKDLRVTLGEARLLRFAGGRWKDAGAAADYQVSE